MPYFPCLLCQCKCHPELGEVTTPCPGCPQVRTERAAVGSEVLLSVLAPGSRWALGAQRSPLMCPHPCVCPEITITAPAPLGV